MLLNLNALSMDAARSTSASSHQMTGECPPSSIVMRFMWLPARAASCLPTGTDPVNDTLRTMGDAIRYWRFRAARPHTTLSTPGGRPASWNSRAMATTALGESSEPLMMMVQPAPMAAVILRIAWL